jgi:putative ABC transport system permease protein
MGLAAALPLSKVLETLLFGISPRDALTYMGMLLVLTAVALCACHVPARRATQADPVAALRCE